MPRGGAGRGQGRKPLATVRVTQHIRLEQEHADALDACVLVAGTEAAAVRLAVTELAHTIAECRRTQTPYPWTAREETDQ